MNVIVIFIFIVVLIFLEIFKKGYIFKNWDVIMLLIRMIFKNKSIKFIYYIFIMFFYFLIY